MGLGKRESRDPRLEELALAVDVAKLHETLGQESNLIALAALSGGTYDKISTIDKGALWLGWAMQYASELYTPEGETADGDPYMPIDRMDPRYAEIANFMIGYCLEQAASTDNHKYGGLKKLELYPTPQSTN